MGLNHHFLLLSASEHPHTDFNRWINSPDAVRVHDDLYQYICDTLRWIVSYNPGLTGMPKQTGFNMYGVTIVRADGSEAMAQVFEGWASLLAVGPPTLRLTGGWTYVEGEEETTGGHQRLEIERSRRSGPWVPTPGAFCMIATCTFCISGFESATRDTP